MRIGYGGFRKRRSRVKNGEDERAVVKNPLPRPRQKHHGPSLLPRVARGVRCLGRSENFSSNFFSAITPQVVAIDTPCPW